jgi:hypothetical protein
MVRIIRFLAAASRAFARWAVVAPFQLMAELNKPTDHERSDCTDTALRRYGSSNATVRLDNDRYRAEVSACVHTYVQNFVGIDTLLKAAVGFGNLTLTWQLWAFIAIPLCLLWFVCWAFGRIVRWVVAGFRQ